MEVIYSRTIGNKILDLLLSKEGKCISHILLEKDEWEELEKEIRPESADIGYKHKGNVITYFGCPCIRKEDGL